MRVIVLGPPGAGKSTQSSRLALHLGVPSISTRDAFRNSVVRRTALGVRARQFTDAKGFLPDNLTSAMVRSRLAKGDCSSGFVLDGYPRTMHQVEELDGMLLNAPIHAVLVLGVPFRTLIGRLDRRARDEGAADAANDADRRQELFAEHTSPVVSEYMSRRLLTVVDGAGTVAEVTGRLIGEVGRVTAIWGQCLAPASAPDGASDVIDRRSDRSPF